MSLSHAQSEIYDALLDDDAFDRLPDMLAEAAGARSAVLQWTHADGETSALAFNYFDPAFVAAYADGFVEHDTWLRVATRPENLNRTIIGTDHISFAAFEKGVLYNEYSRAHGDDTIFSMGGGLRSRHGAGLISVSRGRRQQAFDRQDAARLDELMPHVRRVLAVRGELAAQRARQRSADLALDGIGLCVMWLRPDGAVRHMNGPAGTWLDTRVKGPRGRGPLHLSRPADASALLTALAAATARAAPTGSTLALKLQDGAPLVFVSVAPVVSEPGLALVLFRSPALERQTQAARLQQLFGLTPAEAALAMALAEGATPHEHADARGVMQSTVRSQMKSLFQKTGCSRQAEVAILVGRLPPVAGA